jgi:surfeit locus 1 family protein
MRSVALKRTARRALSPRWLVALGLLVTFIVACIFLGLWQWDRTSNILNAERAANAQPAPVNEVVSGIELDDASIGRPVTATGTYRNESTISGRLLGNETGVWVVSELVMSSGDAIAVVRGWSPNAQEITTVTEPVQIAGIVHPDEYFYADAVTDAESLVTISSGLLEQVWDVDLLPGFLVLTEQVPEPIGYPEPVPPTVQTGDVPFPLQNFFYAIQWWLFAIFAVVVYLRWLWLDARDSTMDSTTVGQS